MDVTKPYRFIRFGAIHGPKPYKFIGFGDIHGPKPHTFIGFGDSHGPKPHEFIGFGDSHGPKPYKFSRNLIDVGGPGGPGKPKLPSKLWGASHPTIRKVILRTLWPPGTPSIDEIKADFEIYSTPKNDWSAIPKIGQAKQKMSGTVPMNRYTSSLYVL